MIGWGSALARTDLVRRSPDKQGGVVESMPRCTRRRRAQELGLSGFRAAKEPVSPCGKLLPMSRGTGLR